MKQEGLPYLREIEQQRILARERSETRRATLSPAETLSPRNNSGFLHESAVKQEGLPYLRQETEIETRRATDSCTQSEE